MPPAMLKRAAIVAVLGLTALLPFAPGAIAGDVALPAGKANFEKVSLLFSLTGSVAVMRLLPDSGDRYSFVMKRTDDTVIWFSDRPARDAGTMATTTFLHNWANYGFARVPPNISMTLHTGIGQMRSIVAVMRKPSYDASTATFTATMQVLSSEAAQSLTGHLARPGQNQNASDIPVLMGAVSLFINNASTPPPPKDCLPNPPSSAQPAWVCP